MRSPKEISVGNGWYWLAGAIVALVGLWFYVAVVRPVVPALEWHRTLSRKMQFADFSLDVPLLWRIPKADFQQPNDISIDKVILPGDRLRSSIGLTRPSFWSGIVNLMGCPRRKPLPHPRHSMITQHESALAVPRSQQVLSPRHRPGRKQSTGPATRESS